MILVRIHDTRSPSPSPPLRRLPYYYQLLLVHTHTHTHILRALQVRQRQGRVPRSQSTRATYHPKSDVSTAPHLPGPLVSSLVLVRYPNIHHHRHRPLQDRTALLASLPLLDAPLASQLIGGGRKATRQRVSMTGGQDDSGSVRGKPHIDCEVS